MPSLLFLLPCAHAVSHASSASTRNTSHLYTAALVPQQTQKKIAACYAERPLRLLRTSGVSTRSDLLARVPDGYSEAISSPRSNDRALVRAVHIRHEAPQGLFSCRPSKRLLRVFYSSIFYSFARHEPCSARSVCDGALSNRYGIRPTHLSDVHACNRCCTISVIRKTPTSSRSMKHVTPGRTRRAATLNSKLYTCPLQKRVSE